MKWMIAIFTVLMLAVVSIHLHPRRALYKNDWVCWTTVSEEGLKRCTPHCGGVGTFGWHPKRGRAELAALRLCALEYDDPKFKYCKLDYCVKYKGKKVNYADIEKLVHSDTLTK